MRPRRRSRRLSRMHSTATATRLLMTIYKDPNQPLDVRMDAAKAAIAYEKPRLAAIEHGGTLGIISHEDRLREIEAMNASLPAATTGDE